MRFSLIVAVCKNNGIGYQEKLPWSIKEDMNHFYKTTVGNGNNAVVMGRKTWNSLSKKPLKNRFNIVLTRNENEIKNINSLNYDNVIALKSINELLNCCSPDYDNIWIIGGSQIYNEFLYKYDYLIDLCVITYIDKVFECDTFFPTLGNIWQKTKETTIIDNVVVQYWKPAI